jgi:ABC-type multidrug transport system ATPase subunit
LDTSTETLAPHAPQPMPPGDAVVQLDGVTVIYGKNEALKAVDARFAPGAVGLLGPNGAGKSTMLKALLGFVKPARGQMRCSASTWRRSRSRSGRGSVTCRRATRTFPA